MDNQASDKPAIAYPCRWSYKLIGHSEDAIRLAADRCLAAQFAETLTGREPLLDQSRTSSGGKFQSFELTIRVDSEEQRLELFKELGEAPEILIVI